EHSEPILMIGVPERRIVESLSTYLGFNPRQASAAASGPPRADIVSGATVTVLIIGDTVVRSAVRVARALRLGEAPATSGKPGTAAATASGSQAGAAARVVDPQAGHVANWNTLREQGAVAHLRVTVGEVNTAFVDAGHVEAAKLRQTGEPDDPFIDLYA